MSKELKEEFKPSSWSAPVQDLEKEFVAFENKVPKDTFDYDTLSVPERSSKGRTIANFVPTRTYRKNFSSINWG